MADSILAEPKKKTSPLTSLRKRLEAVTFPSWTVPLALLAASVVSFGLLIPWLGIYMDDWRPVFAARAQGPAGLWRFFWYDARPLAAWLYVTVDPILQSVPFRWQVFALACRWLTALIFWVGMRLLWPRRSREVAAVSLLFAVYPAFKQQPIAVTFSQQWVAFLSYSISLLAMIQSVRRPRWYVPLTLLGMAAAGLHLITLEYFIGLELLRPLVLWMLAPSSEADFLRRIWRVFLRWLPYLLVVGAFTAWRLFFIQLPTPDRNQADVLYGLFSDPRSYSIQMLQMAVQDTVNILVSAWYRTIEPGIFELVKMHSHRPEAALWGITTLVAGLAGIFLLRIHEPDADFKNEISRWQIGAVGFGLIAIWLGHAPAWITGRHAVESGLWSDRFALPGMLGASFVIVGLAGLLFRYRVQAIVFVGLLIGLATGSNLRNAYTFTQSWSTQVSFYWQLAWRAPSLHPYTAILSSGELFTQMGIYPTSMAINLLYPQPIPDQPDSRSVAYWFFSLGKTFSNRMDVLLQGTELYDRSNSFEFDTFSPSSLVILYDRDKPDQCLWVLSSRDYDNPLIPAITQDALPVSNLSRIGQAPNPGYPSTAIIGAEPKHAWCYAFEKADLARQFNQWDQVAALWDEAVKNGYESSNGVELVPFIEGIAHVGRWDEAREITTQAVAKNKEIGPYLCSVWQRLTAETPDSSARQLALETVQSDLKCTKP